MTSINALTTELNISRNALISKIHRLGICIVRLEVPDKHNAIRLTSMVTQDDAQQLRTFYSSRVLTTNKGD